MNDEPEIRSPGRPSKYDPDFCNQVILDAELGFSLSAFAGGIRVDRDTITEWRKVHPEFDQSCKVAKLVRARFLETGIMKEDIPGPAMQARKFALVNCAEEDWREKQAIELTGADGGPIQTAAWTADADDDLLKRVAQAKIAAGQK